ncbi:MAG: hypothetical protein JSW34_11880 [Candidatus Zixiibacteriota bacterium]|nr:MAG: hypothetical protein JSW34_11880 [candidate division Zixibacteria bacterium]
MKVNPVAIQSYQQTVQRENRVAPQTPQQAGSEEPGKKVKIAPQSEGSESRLAVRARVDNYTDMLTPEEKSALDMLFSRFRDSSRFGQVYQNRMASEQDNPLIGGMVDVKV